MFKKISFIALVLLTALTLRVFAFNSPTTSSGVGGGALNTDGSGNIAVGGTAASAIKFQIVSTGSDSSTFGFKVLNSGSGALFTVRSDGVVTISSTTNVAATGIKFSDNSVLTSANGLGGATSTAAGYITPGYFNSIAGTGGNYAFPASLSIATTTAPSGGVLFVNGNVGIATSTPAYPLDVYGVIRSGAGGFKFPDGTTQTTAATAGSAYNSWVTSGANVYLATSTNSVGIGTSTPSAQLAIWNSGTNSNVTMGQWPSSGAYGFISLNGVNGLGSNFYSSVADTNLYINRPTGAGIKFRMNNADQMILDSSGNLGIGTTGPTTKLDVNGSIRVTGNTTPTSGAGVEIVHNGNGYVYDYNRDTSAYLPMYLSGSTVGIGHSGTYTDLAIPSSGNVGIGTTTPAYKLTVLGNVGVTDGTNVFQLAPNTNSYGSLKVIGSKNSYAGIYFADQDRTLMINGTYQGVYQESTATWQWYFANGILTAGQVPASQVTAGTFASGNYTIPGNLLVNGTSTLTGNVQVGATGTGKITVGTVDPPYTIGGGQYATYLPGMTGQKEETTGELALACANGVCKSKIDFNSVEKGSDLWLFAHAANLPKNMGEMTVLLTPSFDGRVWYKKDVADLTLTVFASSADVNFSPVVSYRFTAPRFDAEKFPNLRYDSGTGLLAPEW